MAKKIATTEVYVGYADVNVDVEIDEILPVDLKGLIEVLGHFGLPSAPYDTPEKRAWEYHWSLREAFEK